MLTKAISANACRGIDGSVAAAHERQTRQYRSYWLRTHIAEEDDPDQQLGFSARIGRHSAARERPGPQKDGHHQRLEDDLHCQHALSSQCRSLGTRAHGDTKYDRIIYASAGG